MDDDVISATSSSQPPLIEKFNHSSSSYKKKYNKSSSDCSSSDLYIGHTCPDYYYCVIPSVISPVHNISTCDRKCDIINFIITKQNNIVFMQWEPFYGRISENGICHLMVVQQMPHLPCTRLFFSYRLKIRDKIKVSILEINPYCKDYHGNVFFYLNPDKSGNEVTCNDHFEIYGSCVNWLIEY